MVCASISAKLEKLLKHFYLLPNSSLARSAWVKKRKVDVRGKLFTGFSVFLPTVSPLSLIFNGLP